MYNDHSDKYSDRRKCTSCFVFVGLFYADTKPPEVISMTTTAIVTPTVEDTPSPINPPTQGSYNRPTQYAHGQFAHIQHSQ